jgi:small subunit ribosomal protein S3Ae
MNYKMAKKDSKPKKQKLKPVRKPSSKQLKRKKKRWFSLLSPAEFGSKEMGEAYLEDITQGLKRRSTVNLMALTGDMKKQSLSVYLINDSVKGTSIQTKLLGFNMGAAHVKRTTKRSKSKAEDAFEFDAKDGKITIKYIVMTKVDCPRSVLRAYRLNAREFLTSYCKENSASEVMQYVLKNQLQKDLKIILKKVHPVFNVLIRTVRTKN